MGWVFAYSSFNGDISNWNVQNVRDMSFMFLNSRFNGNISKWNVGNVNSMYKILLRTYNSKWNGKFPKVFGFTYQ